jgi:hypothetical protein
LIVDRFGPDANQARFAVQIVACEPQRFFAAKAGVDQNSNGCVQFASARENLKAASTPEQFNRFVETFVGSMMAGKNGEVGARKMPAADATGIKSRSSNGQSRLHGFIAGARYARRPQNPSSVRQFAVMSARAVFWAYLRAVA